jgi:predicted alpha/beta superfamily hydrolase
VAVAAVDDNEIAALLVPPLLRVVFVVVAIAFAPIRMSKSMAGEQRYTLWAVLNADFVVASAPQLYDLMHVNQVSTQSVQTPGCGNGFAPRVRIAHVFRLLVQRDEPVTEHAPAVDGSAADSGISQLLPLKPNCAVASNVGLFSHFATARHAIAVAAHMHGSFVVIFLQLGKSLVKHLSAPLVSHSCAQTNAAQQISSKRKSIMTSFLLAGGAVILLNYTVFYPDVNLSPGDRLSVRGSDDHQGDDVCGVSWMSGSGAALTRVATNQFEVMLQCNASLVDSGRTLRFKSVLNSQQFQIGANLRLQLRRSSPAQKTWTLVSTPGFFAQQGLYFVGPALASQTLNNSRNVIAYLPPVVLENSFAVAPVLVMHDGQNLFNDSTSFAGVSWRAADTIDALIVQGAMEQIIVVGLYNTDDRTDEYTYVFDPSEMAGGKGDAYLDFIERQVFPWIERNLPVPAVPLRRADVGMLGSSLGGLLSCYAGYTRSHVYSRVGCMSSSFWWDSNNFNNTVVGSKPLPRADTTFYIDSGDMQQGGCAPPQNCDDRLQSIDTRNHLENLGWTINSTIFYYLQHGGVHNEASWGARFWVPMTSLYPPQTLELS